MALASLKNCDDIGLITNFSNRVQHGRQGRAWKSMEALPMKGTPTHEWTKRQLSLPSSPTSAPVLLQLASIKSQETSTQGEHCEQLFSLKTDKGLHEISCVSSLSDGAGVAELAPFVNSVESQVVSVPSRPDEMEHPLRQKDTESSTHTLESSSEANHVKQNSGMAQEISTHVSPHITSIDCTCQEDAELKSFPCISDKLNDNEEHPRALLLEACSQISTAAKEMEDTEHTSEDIEHVSQVNNIDSQETRLFVFTPPRRADDAKHGTQMEGTSKEVSLYEHLQQDHTGRVEASTYDFIMHRFLPAAQEIATMEHESSITFLSSKAKAAVVCPSPPKPERPPIAHRIKTRAHPVLKGFTTTRGAHATKQDDGMPLSMKSCGFFCLGLKSALFRAHRTVSASRRKSWASRLSSHVKVADEGTSFVISKDKAETEGMEGLSNASQVYSPSQTSPKLDETPRRHAMKHGRASRRQEETAAEGMATHNFISAWDCDDAKRLPVHDLANASMTGSLLQIPTDGEHAKSCLALDQAWQDGDANDDEESQFFDALSRLNSVRSNTSFYTIGSPRSQCENVGLQNEVVTTDESGFADASSQFGTPRSCESEDKSRLTRPQLENESFRSGEPSSLSRRFGKVLKLETCEHSGPTCKHVEFEEKSVPREEDWRIESFSRMHHRSLESLYPVNAGTVSPILPAKCQSSSTLGWPLGISTSQSRVEQTLDHIHPEKRVKKYMPGLNVLSPPLPPSPKGSWLGKAITKNASTTSPLAALQQKNKVASARKKLDFLVTSANADRRWEDVVKGSQVQTGHLRFSEELHLHHPLNHSEIQPLKL